MLLGHDISIVHGLDTCLNWQLIAVIIWRIAILDADLIIAAVKGCEMMPIFLLVTERFDALSSRICNRQDQIAVVGLHLYHSCRTKKGAIVRRLIRGFCFSSLLKYSLSLTFTTTYLECSHRCSPRSKSFHLVQLCWRIQFSLRQPSGPSSKCSEIVPPLIYVPFF